VTIAVAIVIVVVVGACGTFFIIASERHDLGMDCTQSTKFRSSSNEATFETFSDESKSVGIITSLALSMKQLMHEIFVRVK